jgi:hypothetical protein
VSSRDRARNLVLASLCAVAAAAGCTTTKQQKPRETMAAAGFLGSAYDELQPGREGQLALRYVDPAVDWRQYDKLLLEPVQFWAGADSKLGADVQHMMCVYLYNALRDNLTKQQFQLVDLPGSGVIRAQVAIMDLTAATPILRTVSVIIPQARVLNQAQELLTGSYGFSGSAEVALKATDSRTGQLLAAGLDRRSGGGALQQAAVWQWGDAKAAMDLWSQRTTERLVELRAMGRGR